MVCDDIREKKKTGTMSSIFVVRTQAQACCTTESNNDPSYDHSCSMRTHHHSAGLSVLVVWNTSFFSRMTPNDNVFVKQR